MFPPAGEQDGFAKLLYSIMKVHWDKEETVLIPFAPEYFPQQALVELGQKFDDLVADYIRKNK